jgi:hypothetical protein
MGTRGLGEGGLNRLRYCEAAKEGEPSSDVSRPSRLSMRGGRHDHFCGMVIFSTRTTLLNLHLPKIVHAAAFAR